jgi:aconitate hydratase
VPLLFADGADYEQVAQGDRLSVAGLRAAIARGDETIEAVDETRGERIALRLAFNAREREVLLAGGLLASVTGR